MSHFAYCYLSRYSRYNSTLHNIINPHDSSVSFQAYRLQVPGTIRSVGNKSNLNPAAPAFSSLKSYSNVVASKKGTFFLV